LSAALGSVRRCGVRPRPKRDPLAPFESYVTRRFREGRATGARPWREVKAQGFGGPVDAVQRYCATEPLPNAC
jgi:hypothetical protein